MGTDYDSWLLNIVEGNGDDPCELCGDSLNDCWCIIQADEPDFERLSSDKERDDWERFLERI
jgi:hypothetical protein